MDSAEFESLLTPLLELAYNMAYRYTGNRDDAMDLVQDAAVQAYRRRETFKQETNFKAWFLRIVVNTFLKSKVRASRFGMVNIEDAENMYLFERAREAGFTEESEDPAQLLMDRLDGDAIQEAILGLPEEFRVAAMLYFMEDRSYDEIASILEVPVGTVRSRLHRGRKLLQKQLWHVARERGLVSGPLEGDTL